MIQSCHPLPRIDHPKIVNRLVLSGALVNAVDVDRNTPLHVAAKMGNSKNQNITNNEIMNKINIKIFV